MAPQMLPISACCAYWNSQPSHTVQGPSVLTLAARLNQQALLPDMMFPTVNRFNPDNGQPLPTSNGDIPRFSGQPCLCPGLPSMA
jgi:hypothetical protein